MTAVTDVIETRIEELPNGGHSLWICHQGKFYQTPGDWASDLFICCWSSDGGNPGRWVSAGNKDFLAATKPGPSIAIPVDVKAGS